MGEVVQLFTSGMSPEEVVENASKHIGDVEAMVVVTRSIDGRLHYHASEMMAGEAVEMLENTKLQIAMDYMARRES